MSVKQMQAVRMHQHGGPEVMVVEDVDVPAPGPGQVLIQVQAAGVNWADAQRRRGEHYPFPTTFPCTVGQESFGTVVGVGGSVTRFAEGDAVLALTESGAYAEYLVALEHELIPIPAGLDPIHALALSTQGLTALAILKDAAPVRPGDTVLVQAAGGGVGLIAVQLAKLYGAAKVIAVASTAEKRAIALEHGADLGVDVADPGWEAEVREFVGEAGVDVVLDMTGGPVFAQCVGLMGDFGRVVVFGNASGEVPSFDVLGAIGRNLTLRGFFLIPYLMRPGFAAEAFEELAGYVADGQLRVVVGGRFSFDDVQEMHRLMEARTTAGKLIVEPGGVAQALEGAR